jgi:hypothetical protein
MVSLLESIVDRGTEEAVREPKPYGPSVRNLIILHTVFRYALMQCYRLMYQLQTCEYRTFTGATSVKGQLFMYTRYY